VERSSRELVNDEPPGMALISEARQAGVESMHCRRKSSLPTIVVWRRYWNAKTRVRAEMPAMRLMTRALLNRL